MAVVALGWAMVLSPGSVFGGGGPSEGLCPDGTVETPNSGMTFDDVGCSICAPAECSVNSCLTKPVILCTPGPSPENTACCEANPCNGNCPEVEDPLFCSVQVCQCEPAGCCFVVCPGRTMAPAASSNGILALAAALAVIGALYLRRAVAR